MSKKILTMARYGEVVQIRLVDNNSHRVLETYEYDPNRLDDTLNCLEVLEKLGFDFKKAKRNKNIVYS